MKQESLPPVIESLLRKDAYSHPTTQIELLQTHISWIVLTGPFAYKLKKPVNLEFLDFSSLDKRKFYCEEELRLNQRWSTEIYLDVVTVRGPGSEARIGDSGPVIDYAVKMTQFPQSARLDAQLESGLMDSTDLRTLARMLASQHKAGTVFRPSVKMSVQKPMLENFAQLDPACESAAVQSLKNWTVRELERLRPTLVARKERGYVRECHGDLHLANLVRLESGITAFDCIEFSADLRNIDVMSDVSFLVMDLVAHNRVDFAYEFLNRYLELSGDYYGIEVFDLYFVYHCVIRAKIAAIRSEGRSDPVNAHQDTIEMRHYLTVAQRRISRTTPVMIAMHGCSGSGKTWLSSQLMTSVPAIRVRSDIERKRLFDINERQSSGSQIGGGIYSESASTDVYTALQNLARSVLAAGHCAIVDATFIHSSERNAFHELAKALAVDVVFVHTHARKRELIARLKRRSAKQSDASEADIGVLQFQHDNADALTPEEERCAITVDTEQAVDIPALIRRIHRGA